MRGLLSLSLSLTVAVALAHTGARADEVHLASGRVIEGSVTEQGDKVVVVLESGQITLQRSEVARIERATAPLVQVERREASLAPDDRAGLLKLADFCRDHDLLTKERELLQRVLTLEPDHAAARRRLGYVRTEQGWVERTTLAKKRADDDLARRQAELELTRKRAEIALAEARAARERKEAAREPPRAAEAPSPGPYAPSYYPYGPLPYYPSPSVLLAPRPPSVMPHLVPPQPNYTINGVRDPRSYIDDMQRRR